MLKKFIKISYILSAGFVALLLLLYLLFNTHSFQNYLVGRVTQYVNETFKTRISIGEISYDGWTHFSIRKLYMGDQKQDTTFYVGRLQFSIAGLQVDSSHFILNNVVLDEGLCKVNTYKDGTYSLDVIDLFSDPNDTISDPNAPPFVLELNNLECMDTRFTYIDSTGEFFEEGFDYNRIVVYDANFRSKKFKIIDDSLVFDVRNFSCKERCGFEVLRMKADAILSSKAIVLNKLDLVTPHSHIKNYLSLTSGTWKNYSDFNNKVKLNANLTQSELDMRDVAYFVPDFKIYHYKANASGQIIGVLSNLNFKNMQLSLGSETKFSGNAKMIGLPNIEETFMSIQVDYFSTNKKDLEKVIAMELPQAIEDLGKIVYKGNYTGFYQDFVSYGNIETAYGSAETDLNMKLNEQTLLSEYSGSIKMNQFQLGAYLHNPDLGILDMDAQLIGRGFDLKTLNTQFNSHIAALGYNGYTYRNMDVRGNIKNKDLLLDLTIADTNLEMQTQIRTDLGAAYKHIVVSGNIGNANLKVLNLYQEKISLGTNFSSDFYFKDFNDYYGNLMIEDFSYDKGPYTYKINQLKLEADNAEEEVLTLTGDFVKGKIKGEFDLGNLYDQLVYWSLSLGESYFHPKPAPFAHQKFDLELSVLSTASISPLFFPGTNATNLELEASVNSESESWQMAGYIGNVNSNGWQLNQTTFRVNEVGRNSGDILLGFKNLSKSDTLIIGDFALKAEAKKDLWDLQYQIQDTQSIVQGDFKHEVIFEADNFYFNYQPSWVKAGNARWEINEGKSVKLNNQQVDFEKFLLSNGKQQIAIDGFYHFSGIKKNISAKVQDLNLNTINQFVKEFGVTMGGEVNGYLVYQNIGNRDVVITQLNTQDFSMDGDTLGDFLLNMGYREKEEDLLIDISSLKGKIKELKGSGVYDIQDKKLDLAIDFGNSRVDAFQAFVKDYVKLYDGNINLNARLSGPLDNLLLDGQLNLSQTTFRVEYLQTKYTLETARVNFKDNLIQIVPFLIKDINKKEATVRGEVTHQGFNNLNYNISINDFNSFQVLNTVAKDNELFFGNAYATGKFTIKGGSNDVSMYIDALTEKGTKIMVNPFGASSETGETFIHYTSRDTIYGIGKKRSNSDMGVGVYMNITANPNAEIQVIMDAKSDDKIKAKGKGKIRMDYLPNGNFLMYGEYELSEGEYRFSAMNVVAKKFNLRPGSRIVWSGDPLAGRMDISGIYNLKTTINEIVNMTTASDPNVRVPVECIINIRGIVEKPEFVFDLNFPDLSNNVTGTAAAELQAVLANFRREPEMMNQQMLFLLISGSFVPITNTNNSGGSNIGTQTVSDLLSKQAAGLIGKAVPNFDVSVDLLNASDPTKGRTVLLSASKRFMDNRLEVQTSYAVDQTQSNLAFSYNLKKNGSTKLKVFNKSGFDALYNQNIITSGVGLFYRKEFDEFHELFKRQKNTTQ